MEFLPAETLSPDVAELSEALCETLQNAFDDLDGRDLEAFDKEFDRLRHLYRQRLASIRAGQE